MVLRKKPEKKRRVGEDTDQDTESVESNARKNTVRRMRKLLYGGAAAGITAWATCTLACDPLPPPIIITGEATTDYYAEYMEWYAKWVSSGSDIVTRVRLWINVPGLAFTEDPLLSGATLLDISRTQDNLIFDCRPEDGVTSVILDVSVRLGEIFDKLLFTLDVSGTPQDGEAIPITSRE